MQKGLTICEFSYLSCVFIVKMHPQVDAVVHVLSFGGHCSSRRPMRDASGAGGLQVEVDLEREHHHVSDVPIVVGSVVKHKGVGGNQLRFCGKRCLHEDLIV